MADPTADTTERTDAPASDSSPTDALKDAGQKLLGLLVQRAAQVATDRVGDLSDRLTDYAENGGPGLKAALSGGSALAQGKSPLRAALSSGFTGLKETVKGAFGGGGGGGGGKKLKVTVISEDLDVGLPLRTTYNLWTQFADFSNFMKKVEGVEQSSDEKSNWKAQVFLSHRSWEATIVEQVPDSHIVWRSKGTKGHVDGAVSFTELGPNLTRVLLVLEYYPQGLFERTGNLWRAQGRRARLEFQHFRRHAMSSALTRQDEIEGWRGEIRDSEVVQSHEDAVREEQEREEQDADEQDVQDTDEDTAEDTAEDTDGDYAEDTAEDEDADEGTDDREPEEYDEDDFEDDLEDDFEDEDAEDTEDTEDEDEPEEYDDESAPAGAGRGGDR
jgi:hypothetical protein